LDRDNPRPSFAAFPNWHPVAATETLWPSGRLDFDNTPLVAALAEANCYSRHKIILTDSGLGALQVSGVFRAAAAQDLAQSLAVAFDLQVAIDPKGDYVLGSVLAHSQARAHSPS
jgi:transmembrane sensor